jgi:hypothetical protein
VDRVSDSLLFFLVVPGIEPGPLLLALKARAGEVLRLSGYTCISNTKKTNGVCGSRGLYITAPWSRIFRDKLTIDYLPQEISNVMNLGCSLTRSQNPATRAHTEPN